MIEEKSIIAIMYDFDKTLCTKDMQEYTFIPNIDMNSADFWKESNGLAENKKMDKILSYMYLMLKKANERGKSVHRDDFVNLGKDLELFAGLEEWFDRINSLGRDLGVIIEHYVISSGLKEIIEGSSIYGNFKEVFGCEFYYDHNDVACWPKNAVNYTNKTQFLFRINKGVLDISNDKDLNKYTPDSERMVPFRNMIYIGDGLTDVPCMKLVKINGGFSIAVYQGNEPKQDVRDLIKHGRVDFIANADYSELSELDIILSDILMKIAMEDSLIRRSNRQNKEINN